MRASLFLLPVTAVLLAGFLVMAWLVYGLLLVPSLVIIPLSFGTDQAIVFPPHHFSLALYREYFFSSTWMAPR